MPLIRSIIFLSSPVAAQFCVAIMQIAMFILNYIRSINRNRRKLYEQLQWQRYLLRTGISTSVHIIDMVEESKPLEDYVMLRLWVKMKVQGEISFRHLQTLLKKNQVPQAGDTVNIKYCPEDMSKVLIIQ